MEMNRLISRFRITSSLVAALLFTTLTASPQVPDRPKADDRAAAPGDLRGLQEQIREANIAMREMRDEVKSARDEVTELRQELGHTRDQLLAIKSEMVAAVEQARTRSTQVPTSAQPTGLPVAGDAAGQLDSRIPKVDEELQLLGAKIDDQYQTKVESSSKYRVRLSGMALINAFTTRGSTDTFDLPSFAQARYPSQPNGSFGVTLRQSILGLEVFGPDIAGAKTIADIQADFFGGFPNAPNGVAAGLVRLRTAGLRLDWQDTSIVAGQYSPFFSPLSPTSLASVAYPALASAGNLWTWTPQIYIEHRIPLSGGSRISLQGGIMDPLTGEFPGDSFYRAAQAGERTGQPAYAGRIAWTRSLQDDPLSIGAGGYYAQQNWDFGRVISVWVGTADWRVPLSHRFSLTGEFYHGRAIGGLGAAGGQSVAFTGKLSVPQTIVRGLNSTGGWTQLKFMPSERLEFNSAFGEDFSIPPGLPYYAQSIGYVGSPGGRNEGVLFNGIYHLRSNLMFSLEYQRLRTSQTRPGLFTANQVSLSAATLF
jgi:hypothetical protein